MVVSIFSLLLLLIGLIRLPWVQQKIVNKAESYLRETLGTEVSVGHLYLGFPKSLKIRELYLEDQQGDTLLYLKELSIDTDLWALTDKKIELNAVSVTGLSSHLLRYASDSSFNFSFIPEAFASEDTSANSSEPWDFAIEEISLEDIRMTFRDHLTESFLDVDVGKLSMEVGKSDLSANYFHVVDLILEGTDLRYLTTASESPATTDSGSSEEQDPAALPQLRLDHFQVINSNFLYETSAQRMDFRVGNLEITPERLDLSESRYYVNYLLLADSKALISMERQKEDTVISTSSAQAESPMPVIKMDQLSIENLQVSYDVRGTDSLIRGFDSNHLDIHSIHADLTGIKYEDQSAEASIHSFSFNNPGGVSLVETSGTLKVDSTSLRVNDLHLKTLKSEVNMHASSQFDSLPGLMNPKTTVDLRVENTWINPADILYFTPGLSESMPTLLTMDSVTLKAFLSGTLEKLTVTDFEVEALQATRLSLEGVIENILEPELMLYSIDHLELTSTRQDLHGFLPDTLIPSAISIPKDLQLSASVSGTRTAMEGNLSLNSSHGDIYLRGKYAMENDSIPVYSLAIESKGYDIGQLLNQPQQLGKLALELEIKGKGVELSHLEADLDGTINRFDFNGYSYTGLVINGKVKERFFSGRMNLNDKNLQFSFDGMIDQAEETNHYQAKLDIRRADLEALAFTKTPLVVAGVVEVAIKTKDFRHFNGEIGIRDFSANNGIDTYRVDSLIYTSISQKGKTEIAINSDFVEGKFQGNMDIFTLSETLTNHFNYYFALQDTVLQRAGAPQQFDFYLDLKKTEMITEILVPEISQIKPGKIEGSYDSEKKEFLLHVNILTLTYGDYKIDSVLLFAESDPETLQAGLRVGQAESPSLSIDKLIFLASVEEENVFKTRLAILDSAENLKYVIRGIFRSVDTAYRFELEPDTLMLAYDLWKVKEGNYLLFGNGFETHDFVLSHGSQEVAVETVTEGIHRVRFDEFGLQTLSNAIGKDDKVLTGTLNGEVELETHTESVRVKAALTIQEISYLNQEVGHLELNAEKASDNTYAINLTLSGKNQLQLTGDYSTGESTQSAFNLDIGRFDLKTVESLAGESLNELYGTLSGKLTITGDLTAPDIDGSLRLAETGINPTALNILLKVNDETITIANSEFTFSDFTFSDKDNNTAVLNGQLEVVDLSFYRFDLSFKAENFLVMNTDNEDNDLYYGKLILDAEVDITGTSARPDVEAYIEVQENSNVSYLIPESEYTSLDQSNVVVFKAPPGADSLKTKTEAIDSIARRFQGVDLSANLEINDGSTFNIIIDPITGDQLIVQGNANLNIRINRQGDIQLAGRYELTSGSYTFNFYKLVKREFTIEQGSSITWTGDPLAADLDIRASYQVATSPMELLSNQLPDPESADYNQYRQRLPFLVYLNIEGELTQPEISFALDMPVGSRNAFGGAVYSRLQEINSRESDLNKQVFALLILQHFISDNPFASEGGVTLEDNARRSVSRILSNQLNRLTEDVKGINLDFNLQSYEDYSAEGTEGRTDLEVGLSKNLFNDRVIVKVSGNVNLEGGEAQRTATDYIGDLVIEYKITEDGRLRLTGFRRNEFDVISGEITETGTGVIYVREYNLFKELFQLKNDNEG